MELYINGLSLVMDVINEWHFVNDYNKGLSCVCVEVFLRALYTPQQPLPRP